MRARMCVCDNFIVPQPTPPSLSQGILLVYDITQEQTFANVTKWLGNIRENAVDDVKIVLIGNKLDLENDRQVAPNRGEKVSHLGEFW